MPLAKTVTLTVIVNESQERCVYIDSWQFAWVMSETEKRTLFSPRGVTALFTKPPAEPFPALPGTIPENAVKLSMGNGLWGSFQPPAERWTAALWIALLSLNDVCQNAIDFNDFLTVLYMGHILSKENLFQVFDILTTSSDFTDRLAANTKQFRTRMEGAGFTVAVHIETLLT